MRENFLTFGSPEICEEEIAEVVDTLRSGWIGTGPKVGAFEEAFKQYVGAEHAIAVSSCTAALHLSMIVSGVGPGDEVITTPMTFCATANAIVHTGAKPVFVDICEDGNIDPQKLEAAINSRTRAVMPVHLTGRPAKMAEILEIARQHDLFVLEDAAQALGASLDGKTVGSWGHAAAFSLHPLKNLHAIGDGGMVTSQNSDLIALLAKSRNHGLEGRERCEFWSFNNRLDEMQAALLRVQLRHLQEALRSHDIDRLQLMFL